MVVSIPTRPRLCVEQSFCIHLHHTAILVIDESGKLKTVLFWNFMDFMYPEIELAKLVT